MSKAVKLILAAIFSLTLSALFAYLISLPVSDETGASIANFWCSVVNCSNLDAINSFTVRTGQFVSLGAFLILVATMIISDEYRFLVAISSVAVLIFFAIIPPDRLLNAVEWGLILFLIGSMSFAYILKKMKVFRYLSIKLLGASRGNPYILTALVGLFAWFLATVVDEVTSIIYVVMLLEDIYRVTKVDIRPMAVFAVLSTNVGSLALPVGNPIGVYIAFTAGLTVNQFLKHALPLSLLLLFTTIALFVATQRSYLRKLGKEISMEKIKMLTETFISEIGGRRESALLKIGAGLLLAFFVTVGLNDVIAEVLTNLSGTLIHPHSLLPFIPFPFVALASIVAHPTLSSALERGVEWSSLVFFMALFMMGSSLLWTGVTPKIAFLSKQLAIILFGNIGSVYLILEAVAASLSSVLDNLSVIVAFTGVAKTIEHLTGVSKVYWALLYGGVIGGNYTPVGSTANLIALALLSKKFKISWSMWLKIAAMITTIQLAISMVWWIYMI